MFWLHSRLSRRVPKICLIEQGPYYQQEEAKRNPSNRPRRGSTLAYLPTELLIRLYCFSERIETVAALAQTSRRIYNVWRDHAGYICKTVAPKHFPNLDVAEQLLEVQEVGNIGNLPPSLRSVDNKGFLRVKRLLFNARCATSCSCSSYWKGNAGCMHHYRLLPWIRESFPAPTQAEIVRFERAFYHLWIFSSMAINPQLQEEAKLFLEARTSVELLGLDEMADWMRCENQREGQLVRLALRNDTWTLGCWLVRDYCTRKQCLHRRFMFNEPEAAPWGYWAFFDSTQVCVHKLPLR